ncbi:restriction endonuclease [Streptomyces sp. SID13666]|uniref:restriction endonuclease n=1 Tax=Streptomyces sp. SID13666 TaxID=2706054 RepID=UPI001EF3A2D4|nr:restriction endonuclease [Streptomyces sp. SID13666]
MAPAGGRPRRLCPRDPVADSTEHQVNGRRPIRTGRPLQTPTDAVDCGDTARSRAANGCDPAKRIKNVVRFETVSALAGVVEHKRAAKGILVTTSWFGRRSEAFANEHGRLELLDGGNLVHLFKEAPEPRCHPGPIHRGTVLDGRRALLQGTTPTCLWLQRRVACPQERVEYADR